MARTTKPAEILTAIRDRLVSAGAFTSKNNCLIAQPDQDWQNPPGDTWATLWMDGGNFDLEQIDGGMPTITAAVTIVLHSQILTDKAGVDELAVVDRDRGLLAITDKIFQALWLHDLVDIDAVALLAEPMRPVSMGEATRTPGQPGTVTLSWQVMFEWEVDA